MFELVEIDARSTDPSQFREIVLRTLRTGDVTVFRGSADVFSLDNWRDFLRDQCGLDLDRSHYSISEKIEPSDWWEISYQPEKAISYAYSKTRQPLHTDNAWFSDPAELNVFFMKKQAPAGGENTIYPLPRLIDDLQSDDPALLNDLCTVPVIIKKGSDHHFNRTTIIVPGDDPRIFWNFYRTNKSDAAIEKLCNAFFEYLGKKEATSSVQRFRSNSGDTFLFHDQKVLHGRNAFEAEQPYERVLYQSMWRIPAARKAHFRPNAEERRSAIKG